LQSGKEYAGVVNEMQCSVPENSKIEDSMLGKPACWSTLGYKYSKFSRKRQAVQRESGFSHKPPNAAKPYAALAWRPDRGAAKQRYAAVFKKETPRFAVCAA
jgi:hypothetical protein